MASLEEIARVLGGAVRAADHQQWLDTRIGELRVAVIRRVRLISGAVVYDLVVFMPCARELDPFARPREIWQLDGPHAAPRLHHGFVFGECRAGVLVATSPAAPSLEQIVATLWELADWARKPWASVPDPSSAYRRYRRHVWQRRIIRLVAVVIIAVLLRRLTPPRDRSLDATEHRPPDVAACTHAHDLRV